MLEQLKEEFAIGVLECGKFRNIRDCSLENVAYAEKVKDLCNLLQDTIRSKSPQQSLLAEKYCIVFQRNYCTTNEAERGKLNDQLMKLADAQTSVSLVMEPERYREFARQCKLRSLAESKQDGSFPSYVHRRLLMFHRRRS